MSYAFKCDICREFSENNNFITLEMRQNITVLNVPSASELKKTKYEICSGCLIKIRTLIHELSQSQEGRDK